MVQVRKWWRPLRGGFTLADLLIVILIGIVLIAGLLPALQQCRSKPVTLGCRNNLRQLGLGIQAYHDVYLRFPHEGPDQTSGLYVSILGNIEQQNQLDSTGQVPHPQVIKFLFCPSRRNGSVGPRVDYATAVNYSLKEVNPKYASILGGDPSHGGPEAAPTLGEVTNADGTSNTLLLSHKELRPAHYRGGDPHDVGWAVPWKENPFDHQRLVTDPPGTPRHDSPLSTYPGLGFGSPHLAAVPCLFADGSVRNLSYGQASRQADVLTTWQLLWAWNDGNELDIPSY